MAAGEEIGQGRPIEATGEANRGSRERPKPRSFWSVTDDHELPPEPVRGMDGEC